MIRSLEALGVLAATTLLIACSAQDDEPGNSPNGPADSPSPSATETVKAEPPPTLAESVQQVKQGVVRIEVTRCDGSVGSGSGFFMDSNNIATVAHVVEGARTISLRVGANIARGELLGRDNKQDLAVIRAIRPIGGHAFKFAKETPTELQEVAVLGFPLGLPLTHSPGAVTALGRTVELEDKSIAGMIQTNAPVNPGNSGGPMINVRGRVLGLVESGYNQAQGLAYAVPVNTAAPILQRIAQAPAPLPLEKCVAPYADILTVDSVHPDAPAIGASLANYFTAINAGSYDIAWGLLTGDQRGEFGDFDVFATDYSTTYVDKIRLKLSDGISETANTADVKFRSFQDSEFGPDGSTCTRWNLRYTMKINSGYWQIAGAEHLGVSPSACLNSATN